jgi:hypothetical protein
VSVGIERVAVGCRRPVEKTEPWLHGVLRTVAFLVIGFGKPAEAGRLDYQLGAGAYVGFTDNALGVPSGTPGSGRDGLMLGRVDAGLTLPRPFSEHRLAYAFTASAYMAQSGGKTLSNSLGWEAEFQPFTSLRLTTSVAGTQGRLTALDVAATSATGGPSAGPTGPRPASALLYASADAREGLTLDMGPHWRLLQSFVAQGFWPLEADSQRPISYSGELGVGLEREFARDGLSLNARGVAMQSSEVSSQDVVIVPRYRTYVGGGELGWRHTLTPVWSSYLAGGGMIIETPAGSRARFQPTGQVAVRAHTETSELSARAERAATPNVFAGQVFVSTRAVLTTSVVFGQRRRFELRGLGSFDRASAVGASGENLGGATVWQGRVVGSYGAPGPLLVSLEYAFTDQEANAPASSTAPVFFTFRRNLVMLGVEYKYASLPPPSGGGGARPIREAGNPAEDPRDEDTVSQ